MKNTPVARERGNIQLPIAFIDAISATTNIEEVLDIGARWLASIIDCSRCSITYKDHGRLIAQGFRSDRRFEPVNTDTQFDEITCRGRVLATGQPVHLDHASIVAAGGPVFEGLLATGIRSIMIVPMISSGETIGTIAACRYGDKGFTATGPDDLIARVGGDEFVIVTRTDPQQKRLGALAADLVNRINMPVDIDGVETRVGASIGTAVARMPGCTAGMLIADADLALYEVKRSGRRSALAFDRSMRDRYDASQRLIVDLHDAVARQAFEPYFLPEVALATGALTGLEILARWPYPTLGILGPEEFLDIALEARLLDRIDAIVRSKGLAALHQLRVAVRDAPKISFNASAAPMPLVDLSAYMEPGGATDSPIKPDVSGRSRQTAASLRSTG